MDEVWKEKMDEAASSSHEHDNDQKKLEARTTGRVAWADMYDDGSPGIWEIAMQSLQTVSTYKKKARRGCKGGLLKKKMRPQRKYRAD